jgi:hypothetical protein
MMYSSLLFLIILHSQFFILHSTTPTRIRTRNPSFEARHDIPFHHRGGEIFDFRLVIFDRLPGWPFRACRTQSKIKNPEIKNPFQ